MTSVKRENNAIVLSEASIILDIEGTTSSISFVKDVLFPYVEKHLEEYVRTNWDSAEFQEIVKALRKQAEEDKENNVEGVVAILESGEKDDLVENVIKNVVWQMRNDRKTKCLKDLQGLIMEEGYKQGDLKGHVYDDVEPNLKSWTESKKSIYIYSSGSVHAQKLLFGHSVKGNLLTFIKGHFDTTVGMKGETESYKKILEEISCSPSGAAFLTDVPTEARAAKEAGIKVILLSREGNAPLTEEDIAEFPVITSFEEIEFDHNIKKRKVCTETDVTSDNKSVTTCEVSVDKKLDPIDPKLTINGDVELMEVEESAEEETAIKEDKHKSKNEVNSGNNDMQETKCDISSKFEENKEEVVNGSSDVRIESTSEKELIFKGKADNISGEQINTVATEKGAYSDKNGLDTDKALDKKEEKYEENPDGVSIVVVEENMSETTAQEKKETGLKVSGEINQTNGVSSEVEEKSGDVTANGNEERAVKTNNETIETNESPCVVEKEVKSIGADQEPNQSSSQKMLEKAVEKQTVSIEEVKDVECDNSTFTSLHKVKKNEPEEKQNDPTESKVDSTVDFTEIDSTTSSKPFEPIHENLISEAEIKGDTSNSSNTGVKENGSVNLSELKETKSELENTPSEIRADEKLKEVKEETNDPQSTATPEILNDHSVEECTTKSQTLDVKEAVSEDGLAVIPKDCEDSSEVETKLQITEIKCDSSSDEKSSIKDATMEVSRSEQTELVSTETEVSSPQITSLSEDVMESNSEVKQLDENGGSHQNGHAQCDESKPENIDDAQAKDSSDFQSDTSDSKERSKTETSGTSHEVEKNGKAPGKTEVDLSTTKDNKVPSIEKTEVNKEETCQSNGTNNSEISQNGKLSSPGLDVAVETGVEA